MKRIVEREARFFLIGLIIFLIWGAFIDASVIVPQVSMLCQMFHPYQTNGP